MAEIVIKKVTPIYFVIKRLFDIVFSIVAIIVSSPIFLIVMIINVFFTKCHPFYLDSRVGKSNKEVKVFKFRTMYCDAESNISHYLTPEQIEIWKRERKVDNDPRITKFGYFLRKTSLDEIPQFYNIFIGNMSFVGPRPITRVELVNFTEEEQKVLLSTKPGLTGYWQVYGRSIIDFKSGERQRLELEYFSKRGLLFDLKLIFMTIPAVLTEKGAK